MLSESVSVESSYLNKNDKFNPLEKENLKKLNKSSNIMELFLPPSLREIINGNSIYGFLKFKIKELPKGSIYCYFFSDQYKYITKFSKNKIALLSNNEEEDEKVNYKNSKNLNQSKKKTLITTSDSLKKTKENKTKIKIINKNKQTSGLSNKKNSMYDQFSDDNTFNEIPFSSKIKRKNSKVISKKYIANKPKSKKTKSKKKNLVSEIPKKMVIKKTLQHRQIKKKRKNYFFKKIFDIEAIHSYKEITLVFPIKMNIKNKKLLNTINHKFQVINNSEIKELLVFSINNNLKFLFSTENDLKNNKDLYNKIINPNLEFEENEFFSTSNQLKIIPVDSITKSEPIKVSYKIEKISKSCLRKKIKNYNIEIILDKSHYDLKKETIGFKISYPNVIVDILCEIKVRITNSIYCPDIEKIKKDCIIYEKTFELKKSKNKKKDKSKIKERLSHYQVIIFEESEKTLFRSVKTANLENSYRLLISYQPKEKNKFEIMFDKPLYFIENHKKRVFSEDKIIKELDKLELKFLNNKDKYLMPYCEFDV